MPIQNIFKLQLILFLILLAAWTLFFPVLEAADEPSHFCHADYIASRNRLPNLNIMDGCFLLYQPLYYLTLVPTIKLFNRPEYSQRDITPNPKMNQFRNGQYSQFVHSKDELRFSWNSFILMIHTLRINSSLFAIIIFLLTWKLSKFIFPNGKNNWSLLLFMNPMFLHLFSSITNTTLTILLASIFIAIDIFHANKAKSLKSNFIQGIILGLGLITKLSIYGLFFAYALITFLNFRRYGQSINSKLKELTAFALGVLLTSGWYIYRAFRLYGEPLEINILNKVYPQNHHLNLLREIGPVNFANSFFLTIFKTFWSGYGALTINFPQIVNVILLILTLAVIYTVHTNRSKLNMPLKICIYYFFAILIGLIISNFKLAAMHAKDLFPAYIPICLLFAFAFIRIKDSASSLLKNKRLTLVFLAITFYFYAQSEIISSLKSLFLPKTNFLPLSLKGLTVLASYILILKHLSKAKLDDKKLIYTTWGLFAANILIVIVSNYLLYFKY